LVDGIVADAEILRCLSWRHGQPSEDVNVRSGLGGVLAEWQAFRWLETTPCR
jgi:hypothetical protein